MAIHRVISARLARLFGPVLADWPVAGRETAVSARRPDEAYRLGSRWPR